MVGFIRARIGAEDGEPKTKCRAKLVRMLQKYHIAARKSTLEDVFVAAGMLAPQSVLTEEELLNEGTGTLHYPWPELAASVTTIAPPSVTISDAAAEGLALNGGDDGYRALRDATRSRDYGVRQAARAGLRLVDEQWAEELLANSPSTDDLASTNDDTMNSLRGVNDDAESSWRSVRPGDQPWLVDWAFGRGSAVPVGQAAVALLIEALGDDEAAIRIRAAATLGQLAALDGKGSHKKALQDESPTVRQAAFIALAKINRAWDPGT